MKQGFSLADCAVSVTILAIIASLASTSFLSLAPKYRLLTSVWEVQTLLYSARYKALIKSLKVRIRFFSCSYTIDIYNEEQKEWEVEKKRYVDGVIIKANNNPCFHPNGAVSNLCSIVISNSWGTYKITVAITGRIKSIKI